LPDGASGIFAAKGVKPINRLEAAAENSRYAQARFGAFLAALGPIATAMPGRAVNRDIIRRWTKRQ